jgi:hypothetical protein
MMNVAELGKRSFTARRIRRDKQRALSRNLHSNRRNLGSTDI